MTRSLKTRKPTTAETKRIQAVLEETMDKHIRRRAEVILFYAAGLGAVEIARALGVHVNTVYTDLHTFDQEGPASLVPMSRGGAPARITPQQAAEMCRLAEREPIEFGLPYGRWSLSNLQDFLIHRKRLLKWISREHLRRVLKKGGSVSSMFSANSSARIPSGGRFGLESALFSSICRPMVCSCFSMSNL